MRRWRIGEEETLGSAELDDSLKEVSMALEEWVYENKQISNTNNLRAFTWKWWRDSRVLVTVRGKLDAYKAHFFCVSTNFP